MVSNSQSRLLHIIEDGTFWTLPDPDLLGVIKAEFPLELNHLKHAYSVRPHDWEEKAGSPSRILFPDEPCYDEVNRSLVGVLALRWINDYDYDTFAGCQPSSIRLKKESFDWIREIFEQQGIINSRGYKLYVLVTSMVINDLGKSRSFIKYCEQRGGINDPNDNHDMMLHNAVQKGLVPAIERLRPEYRDQVKRGIKLGGEFNVGQLAQAENVPASLASLSIMMGRVEAWNLRWMEQLLDIAGAAGHENHAGSKKFIEPIFRSYRNVYDIVMEIIQGKLSLRDAYDLNLTRRYQLIVDSGWQPHTKLHVERPEDRAMMRLFCMGNVADPKSANLYYDTFHGDLVSAETRQQLIEGLSQDGSIDRPAIQLTYGPGMCMAALSQASPSTLADSVSRERILAAMLTYFGKVLVAPPSRKIRDECDVTVIERDIRVTLKATIESPEFKQNPDILIDASLPEDVVANRLPTFHERRYEAHRL